MHIVQRTYAPLSWALEAKCSASSANFAILC
jgi:hypothetical protein